MTTIYYTDPELLIALNRKVIFVNPNDLQIFKEVELPDDLTKCGLKATTGNDQDGDANEEKQSKSTSSNAQQEQPTIQHAKQSPNGLLLAITTTGQKALLLYQCRPEHAKLLSARPLARASSALTFASDSKTLLVTDKTGDCYQYDCENVDAAPKLLLGHLSIVYDVLWTPNMKHIITCDRDDKIRVSNYPETHDIHGYCLGHKEFVAGIALLESNALVSISGDKTLRIWNYESGDQLASVDLPAPGIRLTTRRLSDGKFQVAVVLYQPDESVIVYELSPGAESGWEIKEIALHSFPNVIVSNFCYVKDRLVVTGIESERFTIKVTPSENVPENWLGMIEDQFKDNTVKPEDVSCWFKKRYDNVSDYLERKKRRIEEKQK